MKQKRTYIQPSMKVVVIKNRAQLLAGSGPLAAPKGRFIDTDDSNYVWDEGGAN